jgi:hypothetical protein
MTVEMADQIALKTNQCGFCEHLTYSMRHRWIVSNCRHNSLTDLIETTSYTLSTQIVT